MKSLCLCWILVLRCWIEFPELKGLPAETLTRLIPEHARKQCPILALWFLQASSWTIKRPAQTDCFSVRPCSPCVCCCFYDSMTLFACLGTAIYYWLPEHQLLLCLSPFLFVREVFTSCGYKDMIIYLNQLIIVYFCTVILISWLFHCLQE